jgi:propanol-preferring alcohol dehydrogenase
VCRTDIHIAEGDLPLRRTPVVLGHEIVGVIDEVGPNVEGFRPGDRVGVYWLHSACGRCKYCRDQSENYCPYIQCTGWDVDGGYAEYVTVPARNALRLDHVSMDSTQIAPLMCPGISGYAALQLTGARQQDKLGLYGFGPTAYCALKIARSFGIEVYVSTRSEQNIESAKREGARWAGNTAEEKLPCRLDAAILFPPAGDLVEPILSQLNPGGTLVMAPVSASPIGIQSYSENLWGRNLVTLYNLKRADAQGFFQVVRHLHLDVGIRRFPFEELREALLLVKHGKVGQPNAVIEVSNRS